MKSLSKSKGDRSKKKTTKHQLKTDYSVKRISSSLNSKKERKVHSKEKPKDEDNQFQTIKRLIEDRKKSGKQEKGNSSSKDFTRARRERKSKKSKNSLDKSSKERKKLSLEDVLRSHRTLHVGGRTLEKTLQKHKRSRDTKSRLKKTIK